MPDVLSRRRVSVPRCVSKKKKKQQRTVGNADLSEAIEVSKPGMGRLDMATMSFKNKLSACVRRSPVKVLADVSENASWLKGSSLDFLLGV